MLYDFKGKEDNYIKIAFLKNFNFLYFNIIHFNFSSQKKRILTNKNNVN